MSQKLSPFTESELDLIHHIYSPGNGHIIQGFFSGSTFDMHEGLGLDAVQKRRPGKGYEKRSLAIDFLRGELSGKRIIELGPGAFWAPNSAECFAELGASDYVGVEPQLHEKLTDPSFAPPGIDFKVVQSDGWSYLSEAETDSGIVYSSKVLVEGGLGEVGLSGDLEKKYVSELIKEIGRVTPSGELSIHAGARMTDFILEQFRESGFDLMFLKYPGRLEKREDGSPAEMLDYEIRTALERGAIFRKR